MLIFLKLYLAALLSSTPNLNEVSSYEEMWVSPSLSVSTEIIQLADYVEDGERIEFIDNSFIGEEQTLRTVVCTDSRVIVLREGILSRSISLGGFEVDDAVASASGRYLIVLPTAEVGSECIALQIDAQTGETIEFSASPGVTARNPRTYPHDDGSLVTRIGNRVWFFDEDLNVVAGPADLSLSGARGIDTSDDGDLVFIWAGDFQAYNGRGELLWSVNWEGLPVDDGIDGLLNGNGYVSGNGSKVLLPLGGGGFILDGSTGELIETYPRGPVVSGCFSEDESVVAMARNTFDSRVLVSIQVGDAAGGDVVTGRLEARHSSLPPIAVSNYSHILAVNSDSRTHRISFIVMDEMMQPLYSSGWLPVHLYDGYALSPDGSRLAHQAEGNDGTRRILISEISFSNMDTD